MADYGKETTKNAQVGFLDELVAGIQDAVVSAQRMAEKQHIEMVDLYFDDDTGEPLTMDLTIPSTKNFILSSKLFDGILAGSTTKTK